MATPKHYDTDYKVQAVKLAKEIGGAKAAKELGISRNTLYTWLKREKAGQIDLGQGTRSPENAMSLAEQVQELSAANRKLEKEIKRLQEENEFLAEASAFFAASRQKYKKAKE
mgnify:CR=1 FL=1